MRHSKLGLFSSEEIDPVQLVGAVFPAVEEDRGVLRLGLRLFGLFSRRCSVVTGAGSEALLVSAIADMLISPSHPSFRYTWQLWALAS
jgi:hypothetical protein